MASETVLGWLGALGAIVFFGSYAVFIRMPSVMAVPMDPVVYQAYKSFACFASSWLLLLYAPLKFTWWGMVGAVFWVISGMFAVLAVRLAGIGPTQSLWSGLSIFVAYIWGAFFFKETIQNQLLAFVALVVMAVGMMGVGWATSGNINVGGHLWKIWKAVLKSPRANQEQKTSQSVGKDEEVSRPLIVDEEDGISPKMNGAGSTYNADTRFVLGVMCAVVVGFFNGSSMVPFQFANQDVVGVEFIISFGVGAMTVTLLVLAVYFTVLVCFGKPCPSFYFRELAGPALLTGLFWSAGYYCSIYATMYLGMALGWPLVQCQLIVCAMWATFYYKEVTSLREISALLGSTLLIVAGAVLLAMFGTNV